MKHDWIVLEVGNWFTEYECKKCEKKFIEEPDSDKIKPESGCREIIMKCGKQTMTPIQLTKEGDHLLEYPPSVEGWHTEESSDLSLVLGLHDICMGWVDFNQTTKTHFALVCRRCKLRLVIPLTIKTFGQLRKHFNKLLKV
ncbi:MAG TPA: hypothetical protein ENI23_15535 [bacterium]|nr:hypothetical protein [bacterium]